MNGLRYPVMINGVVHSWSNLVVNVAGVVVTGITVLNYNDEQQIDDIYGAGQKPIGRGYGRITSSGSITLLREEIESLRAASSTGRLQDIAPFPIIVMFIPIAGQKIVTHRLINVQFRTDPFEMNEGDTSNSASIELVISEIRRR